MDRIDTRDLASWPDPNTDKRLLPGYLCHTENDADIACYKLALRMAMERFLTDEQRRILHMRFWLGMSMADIGKEIDRSSSTVTKKIAAALSLLRERIGFCVSVCAALRRSAQEED